MDNSELKQIVQQTPNIEGDGFSYPFCRLLTDKLRDILEAKDPSSTQLVEKEENAVVYYLAKQLQAAPPERIDKAQELLEMSEKFLSIFE